MTEAPPCGSPSISSPLFSSTSHERQKKWWCGVQGTLQAHETSQARIHYFSTAVSATCAVGATRTMKPGPQRWRCSFLACFGGEALPFTRITKFLRPLRGLSPPFHQNHTHPPRQTIMCWSLHPHTLQRLHGCRQLGHRCPVNLGWSRWRTKQSRWMCSTPSKTPAHLHLASGS